MASLGIFWHCYASDFANKQIICFFPVHMKSTALKGFAYFINRQIRGTAQTNDYYPLTLSLLIPKPRHHIKGQLICNSAKLEAADIFAPGVLDFQGSF